MATQNPMVPTTASSTFPGCAIDCSTLLTAQAYCLPPSVGQTSQLAYDQCFCASAYLTPLLSTPDSVCAAECTVESDRQLLQTWYNAFCAQVRNGVDPTTTSATETSNSQPGATTVTQTTTSNVVVATTTSTSSSNSGQNSSAQAQSGHNSWISQHWKAVVMIAVIAVALIIFACLAVWLKRRHRRKVDKKRAKASGFDYNPEKAVNEFHRSATPDLWGPHQMQHATNGFGYNADLAAAGTDGRKSAKSTLKGKSRAGAGEDTIEVAESNGPVPAPSRTSTRRARPSELENNARMIGAADRLRRVSHGKGEKDKGKQVASREDEIETAASPASP